jgi:hypothetical protein
VRDRNAAYAAAEVLGRPEERAAVRAADLLYDDEYDDTYDDIDAGEATGVAVGESEPSDAAAIDVVRIAPLTHTTITTLPASFLEHTDHWGARAGTAAGCL